MTVFNDAVKLESQDCGRRKIIGWFKDEVSALGAAGEHVLMQSAILSSLRRLPELIICAEYRISDSHHRWLKFKRATRVKCDANGRRIVRVPGTFGKMWIT